MYIGIIKDESGKIEFWITDEDGTKVSTQFSGNKNNNAGIDFMELSSHQKKALHKVCTYLYIDNEVKDISKYIALIMDFKKGLSFITINENRIFITKSNSYNIQIGKIKSFKNSELNYVKLIPLNKLASTDVNIENLFKNRIVSIDDFDIIHQLKY